MSPPIERWSLGTKLALTGIPFLLLGLLATALTLWVSWQLDGGAAAVNEAGRMRMQAYRLAWTTTQIAPQPTQARHVAEFDRSLALLAQGDPERPLLMPWDDTVRRDFGQVEHAWLTVRALHTGPRLADRATLDAATAELVARIDALVSAVEVHLSHYTSLLHLLQVGLLVLGTVASSVLMALGYHFVLEPVASLRSAVGALQSGHLGARVQPTSSDELGALAVGFNDMAERLQASYSELEQRVRAKTAELQEKRERLQTLYDVSLLVAHANALPELAQGFARRARQALHADAVALRWTGQQADQFVLLASDGLPPGMAEDEHCIRTGDCYCGASRTAGGARVIPIQSLEPQRRQACSQAGWASIVAVPIHAKERLLGELNLFFHAQIGLADADRAMLETLTAHLASGMETLRLGALEREAAVAEERAFLASELHDSIAQSLAFLGIQAQLMRKALASGDQARMAATLAEIELGLKESHGDVRELLLHFRTRTNAEDLEHALHTTLSKFEHQSGLPGSLTVHDQGLPLAPDVQVQALHIVQEALSNVRKHAHASQVWLEVWKQPHWRIAVRDDGAGFEPAAVRGASHVGLRIMRERAERLGAELAVDSALGQGTTVTLSLPA
ncbi:MAG: type IV pili methyl-accepting chemotaxis transducer N-terminal domain-containing protein [Proteobacteria bacterium]|nr:type IV pili methyl-accepting chemotaxis transducer N-terminal domain-containing protein [Pseudomonadota bacterium]